MFFSGSSDLIIFEKYLFIFLIDFSVHQLGFIVYLALRLKYFCAEHIYFK